jgi:hypothetical protein
MDAPSYGKLFIVAVLVQLAHAHLNNGVAQVGARGELHSSGLVKPKTETTPNLRRSTLETSPPANFVDIQRKWHNWYNCTDSTGNGTFENRQYFAPPNYFFLAFGTTCEVTETNGTISTGNQTLVFNLDSRRFVSYANDWIVGNCSATTSAEAEKFRFDDAQLRMLNSLRLPSSRIYSQKLTAKTWTTSIFMTMAHSSLKTVPGRRFVVQILATIPEYTMQRSRRFPIVGMVRGRNSQLEQRRNSHV